MTDRLKKEEFARLLAARMKSDEAAATAWIDGVAETLYESFRDGKGVTFPGFGGFYVRPEPESWVFKFNPGQRLRAFWLVIEVRDLHTEKLISTGSTTLMVPLENW